MVVPLAPFAPIAALFLTAADSQLMTFLEEVHRLVVMAPVLLEKIEADLDAHGVLKKAARLKDAAWMEQRTATLPSIENRPTEVDVTQLTLSQGRPRTSAYVVLVALLLRGYFGAGFKSCDATTMLHESITLHVFFTNLGMKIPGRSTLTELVNAVTNATRLCILDAQIAAVLELGWDTFSTMLQDSTHVEGNSAWPTDSHTMVALVSRVLHLGALLPRLELLAIECPKADRHLNEMKKLDREIGLQCGTKQRARARRRCYEKLLWRARRVRRLLHEAVAQVQTTLPQLDVRPSRKAMAERLVGRLRADVQALAKVIDHCHARVIDEAKVPMAEKVLSISDPDVGFISKGQREDVIGYKPQLARSGAGFITALLLPPGNAADSGQLQPVFAEVVRRTTVVPRIVSVDDGYASQANVESLRAQGVAVLSINGAKGRALTAKADWASEAYSDARDLRSAVESLMFTLKQGFAFGDVARRGIDAVYGELLEKALAYNVGRMAIRRGAENKAPLLAAA